MAETEGTPHNTITPIARMRGDQYELDLVLRNNRTSDAHPLGIYHPHAELHHIKKENIGLIEVMGLAVLPARLLQEMKELQDVILDGKDPASLPSLQPHAAWAGQILAKYPEFAPDRVQRTPENAAKLDEIIKEEIGLVFAQVLEHCGVYKETEAGQAGFERFVDTVSRES